MFAEIVGESFKIAYMTAKAKKLCSIGETSIKTVHNKNSWFCVGKTYSKNTAKVLFSDYTINRAIDELAKKIKCQVFKKFKFHFFFHFNVMKKLILFNCHNRWLTFVLIQKDVLFYRPLGTTCRAKDI